MIKTFVACFTLAFTFPSFAQEVRTIRARIVYFQEANENPADLFHMAAGGEYSKITPTSGVGGESVEIPVDASGKVSLLKTPGPGTPVAVAKVPGGVSDAVFFLLRSPSASIQATSYKVLVADDSARNMPRGSSFICNIGGFGSRVSIGGTGYLMPPGKPAYVKQPEKRDSYNMAAFQVEAQEGQAWKPVKDTMIRFSENERYFFLIYPETGGVPSVKIYKQFMPAGKSSGATVRAGP